MQMLWLLSYLYDIHFSDVLANILIGMIDFFLISRPAYINLLCSIQSFKPPELFASDSKHMFD